MFTVFALGTAEPLYRKDAVNVTDNWWLGNSCKASGKKYGS
jgi:hypothetical protein